MKAWIQRLRGTGQRSLNDLLADAMQKVSEVQSAHLSDLRVLIDKGLEREAQMTEMVKLAMEHQFYRPVVTSGRSENKMTAALAPEHLQDVEVFDDTEAMQQQEKELKELIAEQNDKGMHKVSA